MNNRMREIRKYYNYLFYLHDCADLPATQKRALFDEALAYERKYPKHYALYFKINWDK